ncbi:MAG: type II toxin-antitoxin system VapC family toxin [Holophagales bacterium]|nr:type II toxin-antitoxin system VapC family toxin [Holophagales bacterium]MYH25651.1 type II toxin-antitoxin system VapC family toxin [Holophagales bacterium]
MTFGDRRFGPATRRATDEALVAGDAAVSAISFWEIALLVKKRRIRLPWEAEALRRYLLDHGLKELPVDGEVGVRSILLTELPGDPADRIIVATALNGHRLVTADRQLLDWPGQIQRLRATD